MKTFQQIGKACGGLIKVAEETRSAKNLIEAKIKIRYNYSGFLPATRQAAAAFDEFNPDSEQFFFEGTEAISSDFLPTAPTAVKTAHRISHLH
uniref:Uncharacterized protein n=1 Tax=Cucumis melo TaxID=3656 RepID=A0A9I9DZH1_CUCME